MNVHMYYNCSLSCFCWFWVCSCLSTLIAGRYGFCFGLMCLLWLIRLFGSLYRRRMYGVYIRSVCGPNILMDISKWLSLLLLLFLSWKLYLLSCCVLSTILMKVLTRKSISVAKFLCSSLGIRMYRLSGGHLLSECREENKYSLQIVLWLLVNDILPFYPFLYIIGSY